MCIQYGSMASSDGQTEDYMEKVHRPRILPGLRLERKITAEVEDKKTYVADEMDERSNK